MSQFGQPRANPELAWASVMGYAVGGSLMAPPERLSVGFTVASTLLKNPLSFAAKLGVDQERLLRCVGLQPQDIGDAQSRIARSSYHQIFETAAQICGEPDFGLLCGNRVEVDTFHVVGHILAGESTVVGALRRLTGLHRLLDDSSTSTVEVRGNRIAFITREPSLATARPRQAAEFAVASLASFVRVGTLGQARPLSVGFIHESPGKLTTHQRVLGVTPSFGGSQIETVFANTNIPMTEWEVPKVLLGHLVEYAKTAVAEFDEADMISSLERVILAKLPQGTPQIEQVARSLGASKRTLQRRLEEEGLTFRGLVDRVRRNTTMSLLKQAGASMADISTRVGYSDVRSLRRAITRWTGEELSDEYARVTGWFVAGWATSSASRLSDVVIARIGRRRVMLGPPGRTRVQLEHRREAKFN